jgi:glycosyltransferase involved in cell wall biosynthesis
MRLLFLNHNIAFRGTFFRAHQLGRAMEERGHDVTLVTTSRDARVRGRWREIDGVRVFEAADLFTGSGRSGWDPRNVAGRVWALRGERFDVIHAFDSRPVVIGPALALRRRGGAPLVLDWADWWGRGGRIEERSGAVVRAVIGPVETWFEEAFRHRADASTVISTALERRLAAMGVDANTITRAPNGSDVEKIQVRSRVASRRALGLPVETPLLVHIGVLTPGDAELMLSAFASVRDERPAARLVLLGANRAMVAPGVQSLGFVDFDALQQWLGAADLCLIPLRDTVGNRGRWPGKVNDHLAAGRPTVMTRVGDAPDYLERSGAGWAVEATGEALAREIVARLSNREALEEAGAKARRLAETELSWPRIGDRIEQVYEAVA